jgi:transglutaminase-like putative cysteine protease
MIYEIDHETRVRYEGQVRFARFNLRLEPSAWPTQRTSGFGLTVDPLPTSLSTRAGPYPVRVSRVVIDEALSELVIRSRFTAQVEDATLDMHLPQLSIAEVGRAALDIQDLDCRAPGSYLFPSPLVPRIGAIADWARDSLAADAPVLDAALALAQRIEADFVYDGDATDADTPVSEAFRIRRGVCQDFAHILIAALRSAGLPAAYASGYLRTIPPPGQPRLVGVDAMHAWALLWCGPQRGWVGLDPTNGCITGNGHIFAAMGRDYADVSPIDGVFVGGGAQHLNTSVDVVPQE